MLIDKTSDYGVLVAHRRNRLQKVAEKLGRDWIDEVYEPDLLTAYADNEETDREIIMGYVSHARHELITLDNGITVCTYCEF